MPGRLVQGTAESGEAGVLAREAARAVAEIVSHLRMPEARRHYLHRFLDTDAQPS
jgi:hypothetical protein